MASLALHTALLSLAPASAVHEGVPSIRVDLALPPPAPDESVAATEVDAPEEVPADVPPEAADAAPDRPAEAVAPSPAEPAPGVDEPETTAAAGAPATALGEAEPPREFDPEAIRALMEATAADVAADLAARKYDTAVRDRVVAALQKSYGDAAVFPEGAAPLRYLLRFRIDADGYLFDLSLRAPPGGRWVPPEVVAAIRALSPFPMPPSASRPPVECRYDVKYR